ncbi:RNA-directed DNA polymerase, eukaryota, reverse transcriptase zinc-binding domain protein [Tanacetum coccineum]
MILFNFIISIMSEHDPDPPIPPNPPPLYYKSNEFNKTHKKPKKKQDKSLRAKKTTRTINPEPKVVMKHGKMLSSRQVNVKEIRTHSWAKDGVLGIVDEGMEDGFNGEESMEARDDVIEDGLVSEEVLGDKEFRDEVGKMDGVVKGVFGNDSNFNVSAMFPELSSVNLSTNNYDSGIIFDGMPEIPPPVALNPILNHSLSFASGSSGDLLENLARTGWGNNSVESMRNNRSETVQGTNFVGDNKLKMVPYTTKEGRKVVDMDPIIKEGSKKWGLTIVGHFVGFKMSYREIVGHLKRMWRPYQLDEIIVNEGGLYFFKFKSEDGLQNVIENGPWLVDQKPLFVQRWVAGICLDKPEPSRIPLWVKIYNVPLEA